ncbi:MAG: RDD family protein [Candidatus Cloacimonetes bacterium]|nr:RDD family protein [Candidatus Cloacimonadota bacterium]
MNKDIYAGFWKRLFAMFIDFVLLILISVIMLFFYYMFGGSYESYQSSVSKIYFFSVWFYYAFMESSKIQGTFGKSIMKIKVTNINGDRITFMRATVRYFGRFLSSILLIGFFAIAFTKKKQGFHDMVSGCLVVNKKKLVLVDG